MFQYSEICPSALSVRPLYFLEVKADSGQRAMRTMRTQSGQCGHKADRKADTKRTTGGRMKRDERATRDGKGVHAMLREAVRNGYGPAIDEAVKVWLAPVKEPETGNCEPLQNQLIDDGADRYTDYDD